MQDKKLILIPAILGGVLIIWILLFLIPVQRHTGKLSDRLALLEDKQRKEIPEEQVEMMQTVVDSLKARLDVYKARIYPEEKLLDFGRAVEGIGKRYGLKLISIAPDYGMLSMLSQGKEALSELPMTMTFEGRFSGFTGFMDGLEDFPFLIRIREAAINKDEENASTLQLQLHGVVVLRKERMTSYGLANEKAIDRT